MGSSPIIRLPLSLDRAVLKHPGNFFVACRVSDFRFAARAGVRLIRAAMFAKSSGSNRATKFCA
jgi:hypothetical protein